MLLRSHVFFLLTYTSDPKCALRKDKRHFINLKKAPLFLSQNVRLFNTSACDIFRICCQPDETEPASKNRVGVREPYVIAGEKLSTERTFIPYAYADDATGFIDRPVTHVSRDVSQILTYLTIYSQLTRHEFVT